MVDYYTLTGFHCDSLPDRRLASPVSATARATRHAKAAVRIARDVANGRMPNRVRSGEKRHAMPVAIKPKPYSTI